MLRCLYLGCIFNPRLIPSDPLLGLSCVHDYDLLFLVVFAQVAEEIAVVQFVVGVVLALFDEAVLASSFVHHFSLGGLAAVNEALKVGQAARHALHALLLSHF